MLVLGAVAAFVGIPQLWRHYVVRRRARPHADDEEAPGLPVRHDWHALTLDAVLAQLQVPPNVLGQGLSSVEAARRLALGQAAAPAVHRVSFSDALVMVSVSDCKVW
jgi:alkylation response protein AidB-like acyl-CoA dehydrogenase